MPFPSSLAKCYGINQKAAAKRTEAKITLANLAYNMHRLIFHERRAATG